MKKTPFGKIDGKEVYKYTLMGAGVSLEVLERAVNDIEAQLQNSLDREIPAKQSGEYAMEKLREIDEVAYVRFASVYRQFKDVQSFKDEISRLMDK